MKEKRSMIEILGRTNLRLRLQESPGEYDAIIISGPRESLEDLFSLCKSHLHLEFDDVLNPERDWSPQKKHVVESLDWARTKDKLLISCAAGVSRSSSIAYLIKYQETRSSKEALSVLDRSVHFPNQLILRYGVEMFGPELNDSITEFYSESLDPEDWNAKIYLADLRVVMKKVI